MQLHLPRPVRAALRPKTRSGMPLQLTLLMTLLGLLISPPRAFAQEGHVTVDLSAAPTGTAQAWGANWSGQLGDGTLTQLTWAVPVWKLAATWWATSTNRSMPQARSLSMPRGTSGSRSNLRQHGVGMTWMAASTPSGSLPETVQETKGF